MEQFDLVVIGGGPAGLAAACAAFDSGIALGSADCCGAGFCEVAGRVSSLEVLGSSSCLAAGLGA